MVAVPLVSGRAGIASVANPLAEKSKRNATARLLSVPPLIPNRIASIIPARLTEVMLMSDIDRPKRLPSIPAADINRVDVAYFGLKRQVAVAAQDVADVWESQQQFADPFASKIGFGKVPLGAVRRREQFGKGDMVNR